MNDQERSSEAMLEDIDAAYERMGHQADPLPDEYRATSDWCGCKLQTAPLAARGLYSEMLTQAWAARGRLPVTEEDEIMRLVRAIPEEWALAWPKVRNCFVAATDPRTGAGVLVNRRQLKVYLDALRSREATLTRNRNAARASVESRKRRAKG